MINKLYMKELIIQNAIKTDVDIQQLTEKLDCYAEQLVDWNTRMNLTAITEPQEIARKHFLDCMLALACYDIPKGASLIDVGTGAGFPGVVLKLCRPDLKLTLLDSLGKRVRFLEALCESLEIDANCIHARAEEGAHNVQLREQFDVATARAVAALPKLCEYCIPYVKRGGVFLAMKGPSANEEIASAQKAAKALGGSPAKLVDYSLPGEEKRSVVLVQKLSHTPQRFPRNPAQIAKKPL